jgi:phospholipid/cholesterol/gamma-HCH transport system permease protein
MPGEAFMIQFAHMAFGIDMGRIGVRMLRFAEDFGGASSLAFNAFKRSGALRLAPVREVFLRQVYFTGVEALGRIAIIASLIGVVIITQVINIVGFNAELTGKILAWTVVRELGPLLTAIIIIARSSTAVASELGSMKVNREVEYLQTMGIDPLDYLIMPRVLGLTVCVILLTFYFQIISIAGGVLVAGAVLDTPFKVLLTGMLRTIGFYEIAISFIKAVVFGLLVASVSCYHGLKVRSSITEIPQATTVAVMQSLFRVFILDGLITMVSFIW